MITVYLRSFFLLSVLFAGSWTGAGGQPQTPREERISDRAMRRLEDISDLFYGWHHVGEIKIDSIRTDAGNNILTLCFSPPTTHIPIRFPWMEGLRAQLANRLGFRFRNYDLVMKARGRMLSEYIPNYYREDYLETDFTRTATATERRRLVSREGSHDFTGGLSGSHIALWPSHGYYYETERDRWEWQRARLYGTIEDLYPFSFIQPYLLPMLENAGAYVMLPRERDLQPNEVIVDNDGSSGESEILISGGDNNSWETNGTGGFAMRDTLFEGDNPFHMGSHLRIRAEADQGAYVTYIPDIPEDGEYAVYISWTASSRNISGVSYTLHHAGGTTGFMVDQTMGYGTWICLGTYHFLKGSDAGRGSLVISGSSSREGYITTDAVRFGGGTGNVARRPAEDYMPGHWSLPDTSPDKTNDYPLFRINEPEWKLSGRPRYMEGARYYLQYSGMPDSAVYSINRGRNDYNDDFMSRGEWVNYLTGAPMTVTGEPDPGSPGIPVDLVMAFHTDAGVTPNDSVIGTLAIYSSERTGGVFHNGQSRMASRDLSDIIQTQIVSDIRLQANNDWTRRGLWDRQYSEAWRPHAPSVLLELLSHQNLADLRYGLDPRFRFIVSRSIYKGMLRYLAFEQGREAIVQPLPPAGMALKKTGGSRVRLSWSEQEDPLEPTAFAESYIVYTRRENGGFDNGVQAYGTYIDIELPESGTLFSFRVTAVNDGGESMPGETLSVVLRPDDKKPVLVVNGFTRISGPATFDKGSMAGIAWWDDRGVGDRYDFSHTGVQYDFRRSSDWLDDDSPGWGASYAGMEGKIIPGNSFDFPALYGKTLTGAGYSFISVSRKAFKQGGYNPADYAALIVIFGEQRGVPGLIDSAVNDYSVFTPGMIDAIGAFARDGGNIFISGAYLGTDMVESKDSLAIDFAGNVLGFKWMTNHACNSGEVTATDQCPLSFPRGLSFNSMYHRALYAVEAPDAIEPADENSVRIYRYGATKTSAGVLRTGSHNVVALGFPFETIVCEVQRLELMKSVMDFFDRDNMDFQSD